METTISSKPILGLHIPGIKAVNKEMLYSAIIISALAGLFCIFRFGSSPLSASPGFDQGVFQIMAQGWIHGKIPYRDLFDHKGPVLYIINMIGILISDKYGIFILEWLNLTASCIMMYMIGRSLTTNKAACWGALLLTGIFFSYYANGGNLTETWTLSLSLIPMTIMFRKLRSRMVLEEVFSPKLMFITGICFGLIALIRLNNGILLAAIGVTMLICLLKTKSWKLIGKNITAVIFGFLIPVAPMVLYFAVHKALFDFWFAVIGFNLQYGAAHVLPIGTMFHSGLKMSPIAIFVLTMMLPGISISKPLRLFIAIAGTLSLLTTVPIGIAWHYYFILSPLVYLLFVLLIAAPIRWPWRLTGIVCALVLFITRTGLIMTFNSLFPHTPQSLQNNNNSNKPSNAIVEFIGEYKDVIPAVEMIKRNVASIQYDSIFSVNLHAGLLVYYHLRATPLCRHFYAQGWQSQMSSVIARRVKEDKDMTEAPWILTVANRSEEDKEFLSKLRMQYELADSTTYHRLYHRIASSF